MIQNYLQDIIKNLLIFEGQDKKNLIVRIRRIERVFIFFIDWNVDFSILKQLLFGYVIKSVEDMRAGML